MFILFLADKVSPNPGQDTAEVVREESLVEHEVEAPLEKPRSLARRRQVLEAAGHCFRRYGFHACSMAQIAADAGMSVGHIYRYFPGKEAIIAAIVREDIDEAMGKFEELRANPGDLREILILRADEGVARASEPEQAKLMLEISAESARNPAIREIVQEKDAKISEQIRHMISKAVGRDLEEADLNARVEMFQLIFQGISLRTAVNSQMNGAAMSRLVTLMIDAILL